MAEIPLVAVKLETKYIKVEYGDRSQYVDFNPSDNRHQVDCFIDGPSKQAILLPNAPPNARRFSEQVPGGLRQALANQHEQVMAQTFFKRGEEVARQIVADLQTALGGAKEVQMTLKRRGLLEIRFYDGSGHACQATAHFHTAYDQKGRPSSHLFQVHINRGELTVSLKGDAALKLMRAPLEKHHDEMARANEKLHEQKQPEAPRKKRAPWRGIGSRD